jgi:hypothetical protein
MRAYNTASFDFFFLATDGARDRFHELPKPLPWIEPSVNMPYLDACASYVFGQFLGSIILTAILLEHTLRLAVIDRKGGRQGTMSEALWKEYSDYSIGDFFKHEEDDVKKLIPDADAAWWKDFAARIVRNKTAHLDVPLIIRQLGRWEEYVGIYKDSADKDLIYSSRYWWGAVFHRTDALVALGFLREATEKLRDLIVKVGWQADRSHWASQEWKYDSFFKYSWSLEEMIASLQKVPRDVSLPSASEGKVKPPG